MGVGLGFGEEEEGDLRFWREEEDGGMGRLNKWDFNKKKKKPVGFWPKLQVSHWVDPRRSTHGSQKFRKNDEQFLKNLKL